MVTILRALRHRQFALLWTGQTISRTGDYLYGLGHSTCAYMGNNSSTGFALKPGTAVLLLPEVFSALHRDSRKRDRLS
jgi:hypothetical protein